VPGTGNRSRGVQPLSILSSVPRSPRRSGALRHWLRRTAHWHVAASGRSDRLPAGHASAGSPPGAGRPLQVQDKLDAIAKVLADARADADQVARALVQADRDVAAARTALAKAEQRYRQARHRRAEAVREALLAKLEVDAQQAVIDRRARETYVNSAPSMLLTLLADAGTIADLLDRTKLLGEVAEAANPELAGLVQARVEAEEASQRAAAEQSAAEARAAMRARAAELKQIRAARVAAKRALERKITVLQVRQASLRRQSTRILGAIRAEEAARRRAAQAAANPASGRQDPPIPMRTSTARPARAPPATSGSRRPPSACTGW
jgi:septal ring factor EnvC (AmiA/AmiB activator)